MHLVQKLLLITAFLAFSTTTQAQRHLSYDAKLIKHVYEKLEKTPHAPILQIQYIDVFPKNKEDFIDVFYHHTEDELAINGTDYVKKFRKLGYDYPDSVLKKSITIAKNMTAWSPGAVDELQKGIYYLTGKNPQLFVDITRELKKEEQEALARFMYYGENGEHVNYKALLSIIESTDLKKLKEIFAEPVNNNDQ